jgi:hypothetical protein
MQDRRTLIGSFSRVVWSAALTWETKYSCWCEATMAVVHRTTEPHGIALERLAVRTPEDLSRIMLADVNLLDNLFAAARCDVSYWRASVRTQAGFLTQSIVQRPMSVRMSTSARPTHTSGLVNYAGKVVGTMPLRSHSRSRPDTWLSPAQIVVARTCVGNHGTCGRIARASSS